MANAAYTTVIKQTGAAVAVVGGATTSLAANEYQITDTAKRIIDRATALSVIDNGTPVVDADVTINYLLGKVKKVSGNFTGPVTIDYSYLPTFAVAEARSFELNFARELLDKTEMAAATVARSRHAGLKDCNGTIGSLDTLLTDLDSGAGSVVPFTDWADGTVRVLEITLPSANIFRAFVLFKEPKEAAAYDGQLETTLAWEAAPQIGTDQTEGSSFAFSSGGGPTGYG